MWRALTIAIAFGLTAGAPIVVAQPPQGDYLASLFTLTWPHCCSASGLYRITPSGAITTLTQNVARGWIPYTRPQMDATNWNVIAGTWWNQIQEYDAWTTTLLRTVPVPPGTSLVTDVTAHHADGFLFSTTQGALIHATPDLGTFRTLGSVGSDLMVGLHGRDLWSGDYIVSKAQLGELLLVSPDGLSTRRIASIAPPYFGYRGPGVVQSHYDGDLRVLAPGGMLRLDPRRAVQTTLTTVDFSSTAATFDREPGAGAGTISAIGYLLPPTAGLQIYRLDAGGRIVASTPVAPVNQSLNGWGVIRLMDRDLAIQRRATPNLWWLRLNAFTEVGRPFGIALSASGFTPGIPAGGRTIPLVLDPIVVGSLRGTLAPLLTGNLGVVPVGGTAVATLDLRALGGAVSGARLWAAAVTLDAGAPSGLGLITKPEVLVLD